MNTILFFNNLRGLNLLNYLLKKKINVKFIFLSKKNLNKKICKKVSKLKIPYEIVTNINSIKVQKIIDKIKPELNIVAGFPYFLEKKIYEKPKFGTINLHAGKLPKYRGGSPLNWQIINGERSIGISIIQLINKLDAGKIIVEKEFNLKKNYDIKKVHKIANRYFQIMTLKAINKISKNKIFIKQDPKKARYWRQRKDSDGFLNFKKINDLQVYNFVRAITEPYPCAFIDFNGKKLRIIKCNIYNKKLNLKPGEIYFKEKKIFLACKKGIIEVIKHQYENS